LRRPPTPPPRRQFNRRRAQTQPTQPDSSQRCEAEQLDALAAPIASILCVACQRAGGINVSPGNCTGDPGARNKNLKGDALKQEVDKQAWDDSVKALAGTRSPCHDERKLDWAKDLGDAVLAQQPDVMDAVQRLRSRAEANKADYDKTAEGQRSASKNKQVIVSSQPF